MYKMKITHRIFGIFSKNHLVRALATEKKSVKSNP